MSGMRGVWYESYLGVWFVPWFLTHAEPNARTCSHALYCLVCGGNSGSGGSSRCVSRCVDRVD